MNKKKKLTKKQEKEIVALALEVLKLEIEKDKERIKKYEKRFGIKYPIDY